MTKDIVPGARSSTIPVKPAKGHSNELSEAELQTVSGGDKAQSDIKAKHDQTLNNIVNNIRG